MNLMRFGNDFDTAYLLPQLKAVNRFPIARPTVTAQAAGADGEWDFDADFAAPLSKQAIQHAAELEASTFPAIEEQLDALKAATIDQGRLKLWAVLRDGLTYRWAWAKCVSLDFGEQAGQNYMTLPFNLTFDLSEGVWYGNAQMSQFTVPAGATTHNFTLHNPGRRACPLDMAGDFDNLGSTNVLLRLDNLTNQYAVMLSGASIWRTFNYLFLEASKWTASYLDPFDLSPAYGYLTYGMNVPQRTWMLLHPGLNSMRLTFNAHTGTVAPEFYWTSEYL